MSGIVGLWYFDERPIRAPDVTSMRDSLAHRGPDASGCWSRGGVGLGHRMLWTTPESRREQLPCAIRDGLVITADARLDNRDDVIAALDLQRPLAKDVGDAELILRAYDTWGESCLARLLGDFAFAIWDERRATLFCARDHFGVKPFYYYRSSRMFAFASEIKALLVNRDVPRQLNELRVADYLVPMFEDTTTTFYEDVLRLAPGHRLMVGVNRVDVRRYWSLDPSLELAPMSSAAYVEAFRDRFTRAVRSRLRSAFPAGAFLSGGLDSSSIVSVASSIGNAHPTDRLRTFSLVFDDPPSDERLYIEAVRTRHDVAATYVRGDDISPFADFDVITDHLDEPFWNPQMALHWKLYGTARDAGVRVLLDGFAGDSVTSYGLSYLTELAASGRFVALLQALRSTASRLERSTLNLCRRHVVDPLISAPVRKLRQRLRRASAIPSDVNSAFARRVGLAERFRAQSLNGERQSGARSARRDHWLELTSGIYPFMLEVLDRSAAAFAVEPRYPFLDREFAEFCLALPGREKLLNGWPRSLTRRALESLLPPLVAWRTTKGNLSGYLLQGLQRFGRPRLDRLFLGPHATITTYGRYFDVNRLQRTYRRMISSGGDADALLIWKSATLAFWLERTGFVT